MADQQTESNAIPLASSSNGRASGKPWKALKKATVTKWEERMEKNKRDKAIKKLENELKEERRAELQSVDGERITTERKKAAEERRRLEEEKAKMSARKAARLRRKAGRSKKVKG
ncbi:hypothetical protein EDD16DRAFT_1714798 [Pisolithus croceorrhizus]|nr:hypothetical protein EDD16DRAFT_1714798 [Pisolithus croceorrhizus]